MLFFLVNNLYLCLHALEGGYNVNILKNTKLFDETFSISSSVLCLESPLFQVIFMKNHIKIPLFEGLYYTYEGLSSFQ